MSITAPVVRLLAVLAALCFVTSSANAQKVEKTELLEFSLEELMNVKVKAATKTDIPVAKSPGAVTVITYGQIQETSARSLPELLRLVAGVNVRWNPMMQTIDMRGFGQIPFTSRVLLLIDGVPYNSWNKGGFPQQPGFDFFVLQNIRRVEVIRGPSSALYGENAYWGVINIVTLSGEDLEGGKVEVLAGERSTVSASAIYGQSINNGSLLFSAKFLRSQFPTRFWFADNDSKVKGSDLFFKGRYKGLEFSYYLHDDNADGFNQPIGPPGSSFKSADNIEQTVQIAAVKYEHKTSNEKLRFVWDASFAQRSGTHCGGCHALPQDENFSKKENHGYQLIGNFLTEINSLPGQDIVFGLEGRRIDSKKHGERDLLQIDPETGKETVKAYSKFAFFVQDQLTLAQDKLHIFAGLRYDGRTYPELWGDRFSPRVAAVFSPAESLTLRAGWNRAFHFPDFSALYQDTWFLNRTDGQTAVPFSEFSPNPGLKPEQIENFDLGLEYRLSSNLSARLDMYRSVVEDFIVIAFLSPPAPDVTQLQFENHPGKASIWGGEFELRWDIRPGIRGFANWAYQTQEQDDSEVDGSGKLLEFVYAPKHKINVGGYFGPFAGLRATLELMWRDAYDFPSFWNFVISGRTDPSIGRMDGYTSLNLRFMYDLPFNVGRMKRPLRLSLYARNLLDETPEETVLPIDMRVVGREFFAAIEYRLSLK